jgi:ABC-type amino acid transport substrate-binding protein
MCFFTEKESKWKYTGTASLKGLQIGIATDTSIEELNSYVIENPIQFQFQPYHERYIVQNAGKLKKKRIDTFLFTKNSTIYELKKAKLWHLYKETGCVSNAKIYMAFSPNGRLKAKVLKLIKHFDEQMDYLKQTDFTKRVMTSYQLTGNQ